MKKILLYCILAFVLIPSAFSADPVLPTGDDIPVPTPRPTDGDTSGIRSLGGSGGSGGCNYDGSGDVGNALAGCIEGTDVVTSGGDFSVEGNFKSKINAWTRTIASVLGLLAVGSIVLGSFMMVISAGDEEKIKKGKDIIKWSIIGFLGVISAGALISILVNFIFAIG